MDRLAIIWLNEIWLETSKDTVGSISTMLFPFTQVNISFLISILVATLSTTMNQPPCEIESRTTAVTKKSLPEKVDNRGH